MNIDVLFAGVAVSDLEAARDWYRMLFGRPRDTVRRPSPIPTAT